MQQIGFFKFPNKTAIATTDIISSRKSLIKSQTIKLAAAMAFVATESTTSTHSSSHSPILKAHSNVYANLINFAEQRKLKSHDVPDNNTHEYQLKRAYEMNDRFHREDERLKTYEKWPLDWMDKYQLASTGMFYTGDYDKVKCYFCEVEIGRWEREDEPVGEHMKWSPNCPLLRRRTTNNVPINAEVVEQLLPPISFDICGANEGNSDVVRPFSYAEGVIPSAHLPDDQLVGGVGTHPRSTAMACVGNGAVSQAYFPEYPEYAIEAARIRSFAEWPRHMKQKPNQLAEAGFFYTGIGDRVKCFSCGGGLKDWFDVDEPWEQHALWLSKCRFLKLIKGENYIESVLAQHKEKESAERHQQDVLSPEVEANKPLNGEDIRSNTTELAKPLNGAVALSAQGEHTTTITSSDVPTIIDINGATTNVQHQHQIGDVVPQSRAKPVAAITIVTNSENLERKATHGSGCGIPEEKLCKICYASEYNTAFLPCGHVVACAKCASSVTKCPLCRKLFSDVMRVYFS